MGTLLRSEKMCLTQLYLQTEAAYACVSELGELGLVQFRDLNPDVNAFQRKFVNEVRRCDEMERKLRFLERELNRDGIPMDDTHENPEAPLPREMIDLESTFEKLEVDMKEVNKNQEALKRNFLELTELKHILRKTQSFFEEMDNYSTYEEEALNEIDRQQRQSLKLGFVAGVILREKVPAFERILWRACRGNVFLRYAEIETPLEDPHTGDSVNKCVFIIFFQGDQLKSRVKKICEGLRAMIYPCSPSSRERQSAYEAIVLRCDELEVVLNQTEEHRRRVLSQVASHLRIWFIKVRKIKAIYHTLNLFNVNIAQKCLIAECWCPVLDLDKIQLALRRGTESSGSSVPSILQVMKTNHEPPTFNRTNKFISAYQTIVDAYGVANYREVNPAPFTLITFPFLFGVMFGDLGHGTIMMLFGLWMIFKEKAIIAQKSDNEMWNMIFGGRYIIILMGLFSMYCGFLYNDCFSLSINLFGSAWNTTAMNLSQELLNETTMKIQLNPAEPGVFRGSGGLYPNATGNPYPYGMDPMWQLSENKITFLNSYKMKGAVILGITHMVFGIVLSLVNNLHFGDKIAVYTTFLPRIIFIMSIFGYLCLLIMYKWLAWGADEAYKAPSLLIGLINMFMFKKPMETDNNQNGLVYPHQYAVQVCLVVLALCCVPVMLCGRPFILKYFPDFNKKGATRAPITIRSTLRWIWGRLCALWGILCGCFSRPGRGGGGLSIHSEDNEEAAIIDNDHLSSDDDSHEGVGGHGESHDPAEVWIHQLIETIEYCLSCISHTASYLRLWALSLAHAELSEVLWTMVMHTGLSISGPVGAVANFVIFWFFSVLTVGILLGMEGLSAFLHALRLHWVEFQDKFYGGEGYAFAPFSFQAILDGKIES